MGSALPRGGARSRARRAGCSPSLASLLAVAIDRERLGRRAVEAETLRRSDAIKTAILRAVSHDLRSPLTAIRTATEGLESSDLELSDEPTARACSRRSTSRRSASTGSSPTCSTSRASSSARPSRSPSSGRSRALVGQALGELGAGAERVDGLARRRTARPVEVDGAQIEHVLVNLIDNALKFSPDAPVELTGEQLNGEVVVRVVDHGPGLERGRARADLRAVRARRACRAEAAGSASRSRRGSRRRTARRLEAESGRDGGAELRALAPVERVSARILVVDDEPQILRALETTLRGAGYEIETAATGRGRARPGVGVRPPDGVILDLVLPGKSGVEVCRELREMERRRDRSSSRSSATSREGRGARRGRRRLRDEAVRNGRAARPAARSAPARRSPSRAASSRSASSRSTSRSRPSAETARSCS